MTNEEALVGGVGPLPSLLSSHGRTTRGLNSLTELIDQAAVRSLSDEDRVVIFSDLHLGNGGPRDDFLRNAELCTAALRDYYLPRDMLLVLNGDVEELQRFSHEAVKRRWAHVYELFDAFEAGPGMYQIFGNHDDVLEGHPDILPSLRLVYGGETILIYHGHQASVVYDVFNNVVGFAIRYVVHPLHIRNTTVAHDSRKQFRIEKRVYQFSSTNRLVSIIGHTHRPLFESMSKVDSLKFKIEQLCRRYPEADQAERAALERSIDRFKAELQVLLEKHNQDMLPSSLYDSSLHVPCMFNSGCVIGKRGITAIEISGGRIALVHWFDANRSRKYLDYNGYQPQPLPGTDFYRVVLKDEDLRYVFTRIKLLAG